MSASPVHHLPSRRTARAMRVAALLLFCLVCFAAPAAAQYPPWVEARALNVVDMVGQVPDSALVGHTICYGGPGGMLSYLGATQVGTKWRIETAAYPRLYWDAGQERWITVVNLLGQRPLFDHMSSSAPAAWVRLYHGGVDVTDEVVYYAHVRPTLAWPLDPVGDPRYFPEEPPTAPPSPPPADGIPVPANWGGQMVLYAAYDDLTAVFTVDPGQRPLVRYLGEETFSYPSYIGPGTVGWFQPLMEQMRDRYDDRHPALPLTKRPAGANYVLFVYEPMPYDVYAGYWSGDEAFFQRNRDQPIPGTVRLSPGGGMLSQDLVHGGAFPLDVWWQDADQSGGPYLSVFTSATRPIDRITPPEFVVLPGTPYNECFRRGDCSGAVLEDLYNRRGLMKVVYLAVEPLRTGTDPIPLRFADTNWTPAVGRAASAAHDVRVTLPLIFGSGGPLPAERPLGFFEPLSGRMVGYLP